MPSSLLADTGFPSYQLGKQIMAALEDARLALALEDPALSQWVPKLAKARGEGFKEFIRGILLATDGAQAAWNAGYRDAPIPDACDVLTGLCAYAAFLLRDEIMKKILSGEVPGCEATVALSVLNRFYRNPVALQNAEWFASLIEERK